MSARPSATDSIKMFFNYFVALLSVSISGLPISYAIVRSNFKQVLVISLDGYGHDYLQRFPSSNMNKLFHSGSYPAVFRNQYPTKTISNHFSLATGMFIGEHGVVGNNVFDKDLNRKLNVTQQEMFQQRKGIQPVWILNEKHKGVSACLMWPGCGFSYQNVTETFYLKYNHSYAFQDLIDVAVLLLKPSNNIEELVSYKAPNNTNTNNDSSVSSIIKSLTTKQNREQKPANLVMLYYNQPDAVGHKFGTHSPELAATIKQIDADLGHLMKQFSENKLTDKVDLLLVSDHGMVDVLPQNIIDLKNIISSDLYSFSGTSPLLHIHPLQGADLTVFEKLRSAAEHFNFTTMISDSLPDTLHYKNKARIGPILLQADPGFVFQDFRWFIEHRKDKNSSSPYGTHGYSMEASPEMEPFMVAVGPSFRKDWAVPSCSNVDVFPLVLTLLGLPLSPSNGSMDSVQLMLVKPPMLVELYQTLGVAACVAVALLLLLLVCLAVRHRRQNDSYRHHKLRTDPQALISGSSSLRQDTGGRGSAIMLSEDELDEEERLLARSDVWEV